MVWARVTFFVRISRFFREYQGLSFVPRSPSAPAPRGKLVHMLAVWTEVGALSGKQHLADGGAAPRTGLSRPAVDPQEGTFLLLIEIIPHPGLDLGDGPAEHLGDRPPQAFDLCGA